MLSVAGIPLSSCFFTNFYMGLRQGAATTGRFPGAGDARFVHRCGEFLTKQLDHQRPALVLTLGAWVPRLLAAIEGGPVAWNGVTTLKEIDGRCRALLRDVRLHAGAPCVVAALSHPSFYPRSASARAFGGTTGRGAHELLMHSAARAASIG
jgi:uracil-DNA glycosylase